MRSSVVRVIRYSVNAMIDVQFIVEYTKAELTYIREVCLKSLAKVKGNNKL